MTNTSLTTGDQAKTLRDLNDHPERLSYLSGSTPTNVYSVTSGKGGVGKTAVVANLAWALASMKNRVLVLDADLGLANIDVVFGVSPTYNLNHFFAGERELSEIMFDGPLGIKILPAGSGLQSFIRLKARDKMRLFEGLDMMQDSFDYVLIDTEAGISENVTYFNTASQAIIIVTTPEPTSITDAYGLMKLLSVQHHEKHFNLIVNRIESEDDALDVYRKLTMVAGRYLDISINYLGSIPEDRKMVEAIRKQKVISELFPDSNVTRSFDQLARRIFSEPCQSVPKGNLQFFWKKLLNIGG
jgi:flagellar biosynthesis protein FlhG